MVKGVSMSEYRNTQPIVRDVPIQGVRPVGRTQYESVVREERGTPGWIIAGLILAVIGVAVVVTALIINNQQSNNDEALAQERARTANAQPAAAQQPSQQPSQQPIIVMPQSQPSTVPVPVPVPSQPAPSTAATAPTTTELEVAVNSRLLDDRDLRSNPIDVKVSGETATLGGSVPNDELKTRAEKLAKTVRGIRSVINNIVVKP